VLGDVNVAGSIAILLIIGFVVGLAVTASFFLIRARRQRCYELEYRARFGSRFLKSEVPDVSPLVKSAEAPAFRAVTVVPAGDEQPPTAADGSGSRCGDDNEAIPADASTVPGTQQQHVAQRHPGLLLPKSAATLAAGPLAAGCLHASLNVSRTPLYGRSMSVNDRLCRSGNPFVDGQHPPAHIQNQLFASATGTRDLGQGLIPARHATSTTIAPAGMQGSLDASATFILAENRGLVVIPSPRNKATLNRPTGAWPADAAADGCGVWQQSSTPGGASLQPQERGVAHSLQGATERATPAGGDETNEPTNVNETKTEQAEPSPVTNPFLAEPASAQRRPGQGAKTGVASIKVPESAALDTMLATAAGDGGNIPANDYRRSI
jgi:hypothetical protein